MFELAHAQRHIQRVALRGDSDSQAAAIYLLGCMNSAGGTWTSVKEIKEVTGLGDHSWSKARKAIADCKELMRLPRKDPGQGRKTIVVWRDPEESKQQACKRAHRIMSAMVRHQATPQANWEGILYTLLWHAGETPGIQKPENPDFRKSRNPKTGAWKETKGSEGNQVEQKEEKEEEVQGSIDGEDDNDAPPPPDLILEHQGTPIAAREGILPAKDDRTRERAQPSLTGDSSSPELTAKEQIFLDVCVGNAESLVEKYGPEGKKYVWSLRHGVMTALEQYGLDEKVQRSWLAKKFLNLHSRNVELKVWADALVDAKDIRKHAAELRDEVRAEEERQAQLRRNTERLQGEKLNERPASAEAIALAAKLFGKSSSESRPEPPSDPPGLTREERERIEAELNALHKMPAGETIDPLDGLPPDPGPIFLDDDEVAQ